MPFLTLGFRPLFFVAGVSAAVFMAIWAIMLQSNVVWVNLSMAHWHAHEMIFAYTMAVIAGFLLTAVKNWTGIASISGLPLLFLVLLWLLARFLPFVAGFPLALQAIVDVGFLFLTTIFIAIPIFKARAWQHIGIIAKVLLLGVAHLIFYLGLLGVLDNGVNIGLYGSFYLILALIFVMSRRIVPFFIEKGLGLTQPLKNPIWLDRTSLVLFVLYAVFEVFYSNHLIFIVALLLFVLHTIRLVNWYQNGIWHKTLLWSLYLAYMFLILGFGLKALSFFITISPYIILHSFALGVGMITIAMMSRVALGHTGRNIFTPPKALFWIFLLLSFAFIFRVLLPLFTLQYYYLWVLIAQIFWITAFGIFVMIYTPILFKKTK